MPFRKPKSWATKPPPGTGINWGDDLAQGLVGWWPFCEGAGKRAYNASQLNGNVGAFNGSLAWGKGVFGGPCLDSSTAGSYLSVTSYSQLAITTNGTVSCWINANSLPPHVGEWVAKNGNYILRYDRDVGNTPGFAMFYWDNSLLQYKYVALTLSTARWYHVAGVISGNAISAIYLNGNPQTLVSGNFGAASRDTTQTLLMGDASGGGEPWTGRIDDARIYNRALTQSQIRALYSQGMRPFLPPRRRVISQVAAATYRPRLIRWSA